MHPTWCFQTNHSKHKTSYNFVHWHAKNTWFLVQKSQIVSKYHDNVVSIVLYWTFLGLSAPYEVVERSCAFFCILIYFTRYKMYMCVGIGWSLNLLPFSNQLPSCDFRWQGFGFWVLLAQKQQQQLVRVEDLEVVLYGSKIWKWYGSQIWKWKWI